MITLSKLEILYQPDLNVTGFKTLLGCIFNFGMFVTNVTPPGEQKESNLLIYRSGSRVALMTGCPERLNRYLIKSAL